MKALGNVLIVIAVVCYIAAIISKLTVAGLYDVDIKPLSAMVFGNGCLLFALIISTLKK